MRSGGTLAYRAEKCVKRIFFAFMLAVSRVLVCSCTRERGGHSRYALLDRLANRTVCFTSRQ